MTTSTPAPSSAPVVLVTGTSSGIGRATVERFRTAGWRVAATMRRPENAEIPTSDSVRLFALDVTDEASIEAAVATVVETFGRLDALVNNAGYSLNGPVEALTPDLLQRQFDTNVLGLVAVTRHALPHLRRSKGTVVNIASMGGRMAFPFGGAYHATKFAVEGLSEAMRFELATVGVRTRVVEPGPIKTDFYGRSIAWAEHEAYEPYQSAMKQMADDVGGSAPGPEAVADIIHKATVSRGGKLHWPAASGTYPLLNRLLPDALWRRALMMMLRRGARRQGAATPVTA
jgi:NAD(P)-dependent dehydrogenase (short-subunit alcohol dehydrogenase family)